MFTNSSVPCPHSLTPASPAQSHVVTGPQEKTTRKGGEEQPLSIWDLNSYSNPLRLVLELRADPRWRLPPPPCPAPCSLVGLQSEAQFQVPRRTSGPDCFSPFPALVLGMPAKSQSFGLRQNFPSYSLEEPSIGG